MWLKGVGLKVAVHPVNILMWHLWLKSIVHVLVTLCLVDIYK